MMMLRPDEEQDLVAYVEDAIASHPLKRHVIVDGVYEELGEGDEEVTAETAAADPHSADDAGAPPAGAETSADEAPAGGPPVERARTQAPATDLMERGAGLRILWGAPQTEPAGRPAPGPESIVGDTARPSRAQSLYDHLDRVPHEGIDHLRDLGISRATVARTGIRWSGEGKHSRHLVFPLRLKGPVVQLQFWPLEGDPPVHGLTLTHEGSEPPEGLFGVLAPPDRPLYLTETPLDALSLNEHGLPAVAPAYGSSPSAATAEELRGRRVLLLTADDESGEKWGRAWSEALREHEADPLEVVLPADVEGHIIQGANDFLRTHPLGFAFADAIRLLTATAEDRAVAMRDEIDAASAIPAVIAAPVEEPPAPQSAAPESAREETKPATAAASEAPAPLEVPATIADRQDAEPRAEEQSPYLRSFLEARRDAHEEVAATGVPELNRRLAGGLDRGLYVLAGEPGTGKTAFLEDMAVEAATSGRPVVYYALREGPHSTWERLIARLSRIMGGYPIALHDLRAGALDEEELGALAELDATFRLAILPRLTLVDSVPGGLDAVSAFLDDLRQRLSDRVTAYRRVPLVLIDDLDYLLLTLDAPDAAPAARLTLSLNDFLLRSHAPGVLVSTLAARSLGAGGTTEEHHPEHMAEGLFVLSFRDRPSENGTARLDLEILKNPRTGWLGRLMLRFDRESGLFWAEE